ncbi:MAG: SprB repeat-containing protein [Bacteroidota bacterium]
MLSVTDNAGCSLSKTVTVPPSVPANDAVVVISNDHCASGIGQMQVQSVQGGVAPYTYSTNNMTFTTNPVLSKLGAGSYTLYIKDNNNCVLTKNAVIIENENGPDAITYTIENAACGSLTGAITVTSVQGGSAPYTYTVDNGNFTTGFNFKQLQPGDHGITVKDNFGCLYKKDFNITLVPGTKAVITPGDTLVCYNTQVRFSVHANPDILRNIIWSTGEQGTSSTTVRATDDKTIRPVTGYLGPRIGTIG